MFDPSSTLLAGTLDHQLERERLARWTEIGEIAVREAQGRHRSMELARQANAKGDWKAAGYSSHEAWYAAASKSDHYAAKRITQTGELLAALPALDEAVESGELTFDQAAAAAEFATPETDTELARVAVGKAPREISRVSRSLSPPTVADDKALYARRAASTQWIGGGRELLLNACLPLEQGLAVEQVLWADAKKLRAADKRAGLETLEWRQYTADALVNLAHNRGTASDGDSDSDNVKHCQTTTIVHLSEDAPPMLEGSGAISDETAAHLTCTSRHITIKPAGDDLVHSAMGRDHSWAQERLLRKRSPHCQYPGCTAAHGLEAHHVIAWARGGKTKLSNLCLLCSRHHKRLHDHHITTGGTGENPVFTDASGRLITANRPHAPPA